MGASSEDARAEFRVTVTVRLGDSESESRSGRRVVLRTRIFDFVHPRMDVHICSVLRTF